MARVIQYQRACSSSAVRSRNFVVARSQPCTGGRPKSPTTAERPAPEDPAEPGGALPAAQQQPEEDDGGDQAGHPEAARPSSRPALGCD